MESEDVFILQKIIAIGNGDWSPELLALELDQSSSRIAKAIDNLRHAKLLDSHHRFIPENTKNFLLKDLHRYFPARPGKLGRGILTGAKPGTYFCVGLSYASIWIWPLENGPDLGYEITPLSSGCCFAVTQDVRLKKILAITETLRVAGPEAQEWAEYSFKQNGLF